MTFVDLENNLRRATYDNILEKSRAGVIEINIDIGFGACISCVRQGALQ
jgi:hypothetical protein